MIFSHVRIFPRTKITLCNPLKFPTEINVYWKVEGGAAEGTPKKISIRATEADGYQLWVNKANGDDAPWYVAENSDVVYFIVEENIEPLSLNHWFATYYGAASVDTFLIGLEKVNTFSVKYAAGTFQNAHIWNDNGLDLSMWDLNNCITTSAMFYDFLTQGPLKMFQSQNSIALAEDMFRNFACAGNKATIDWGTKFNLYSALKTRGCFMGIDGYSHFNLPLGKIIKPGVFDVSTDLSGWFGIVDFSNFLITNPTISAILGPIECTEYKFNKNCWDPDLTYDFSGVKISGDISGITCMVNNLDNTFDGQTITGTFNMDLTPCESMIQAFRHADLLNCDLSRIGQIGSPANPVDMYEAFCEAEFPLEFPMSWIGSDKWYVKKGERMFFNSAMNTTVICLPEIVWDLAAERLTAEQMVSEFLTTDSRYDHLFLEHIYVNENFSLPEGIYEWIRILPYDCPNLHNFNVPSVGSVRCYADSFIIDDTTNYGILEAPNAKFGLYYGIDNNVLTLSKMAFAGCDPEPIPITTIWTKDNLPPWANNDNITTVNMLYPIIRSNWDYFFYGLSNVEILNASKMIGLSDWESGGCSANYTFANMTSLKELKLSANSSPFAGYIPTANGAFMNDSELRSFTWLDDAGDIAMDHSCGGGYQYIDYMFDGCANLDFSTFYQMGYMWDWGMEHFEYAFRNSNITSLIWTNSPPDDGVPHTMWAKEAFAGSKITYLGVPYAYRQEGLPEDYYGYNYIFQSDENMFLNCTSLENYNPSFVNSDKFYCDHIWGWDPESGETIDIRTDGYCSGL